jgi:hypothetical protein
LAIQDLRAQSIVQFRHYNFEGLVTIQARVELQRLIRHSDARSLKRFLKAAQILRDAVHERAFNIEDIARKHCSLVNARITGDSARKRYRFLSLPDGPCQRYILPARTLSGTFNQSLNLIVPWLEPPSFLLVSGAQQRSGPWRKNPRNLKIFFMKR